MVMAKLHVICGNCGCADLWELTIERDGDYISSDHEAYEDSASLYCGNCSTLHNLKDSAKKVTFGSGATSPVPAQQLPDDARYAFDPIYDKGEHYITGAAINEILKGGENER